jgi:CRISPR-associated endonuclease/helicase Cas3
MTLPRLRSDDFADFFEAVHGVEPFPWQRRLAQMVCDDGEWPNALDIPTGAGKTAAIDIAVFHLALEADHGSKRRAAVRIAFVVDRRLVVDDAYERAIRLRAALGPDASGILAKVGSRLAVLAESREQPLAVARLRGGLAREPDWVRTPSQPVILVSTVDQVGSRLLFRGYGISDGMKPTQAGLLGTDTVLLLDEAHLSQPFVDTVTSLRRYCTESTATDPHVPGRPVAAVTLSATQTAKHSFRINKDDLTFPRLKTRLRASKPAEILKARASSDRDDFAEAFAEQGIRLSCVGNGTARVVAVVANRVRRARRIFEAIEKRIEKLGKTSEVGVALLLGRTRPLDRNDALQQLLPQMRANRGAASERPLFVVATQCVEAGADLDFDALVTEIAPLDCLRQRFGRLNRMGREIEARAVVLAAPDQVAAHAKDPLYGEAPAATWELLQENASVAGTGKHKRDEIDFGIEASRAWVPKDEELNRYLAPRKNAPILLPAYIDSWSKTSPIPAVDAEPALFLHGPAAGPPEVSIVWRADLEDSKEDEPFWKERVKACPPSMLESVSVPLGEARRWLAGEASADISDVESAEDESADARKGASSRALRWRGEDTGYPVGPSGIRPEDVLIVPASRGGLDRWGWDPRGRERVTDRARQASIEQRRLDVLRLAPALADAELEELKREPAEKAKTRSQLESFLEYSKDAPTAKALNQLREASWLPPSWCAFLDQHPRLVPVRAEDGRLLVLTARVKPQKALDAASAGLAATEDDETSLHADRRVILSDHCRAVEKTALAFAEQVGLNEALRDDVALAAFLHDSGKAHPAFKQYIYGGDELAAIAGPPLAKSGRSRLRRPANFPLGARHEAASIRLALAHPRFSKAKDQDLGDGPVQSKPDPQVEDLGEGWPDLFARLKRAYGPWRLAWLEAIVRLADHRTSEQEQDETDAGVQP